MLRLVIASIIWSASFGLIGNVLAGLPPAWIAGARLAIAALVFLPFVQRLPARLCVCLAAIGAVQFGLMSLAYVTSFRYLSSHEVALFTVMTPAYVAFLSDLFERRFHAANLIAALLAVCGAGLILWKGVQTRAPLLGFALVELANLCFAAGQIAYRELLRRQAPQIPDHRAFFWLYFGACLLLAPLAAAPLFGAFQHPDARQWATLLYLGVLVSGLAYFLWNTGARKVRPGVLAVANNLKIPLGVAFSLLFFHEQASVPGLLAGSLLVGGAFIPALWGHRPGQGTKD